MQAKHGLSAFLFTLVACEPVPEVEERMRYWTAETAIFFSEERDLDQVHSWLREHNIFYTFEDSDIVNGQWTAGLEKIYPDSYWCDWVDIRLHLTMTHAKQIENYALDEYGSCLW